MKFELYPVPINGIIGEIEVVVELTDEEVLKVNRMDFDERNDFIKSKATIKITDFNVNYEAPALSEWDISE